MWYNSIMKKGQRMSQEQKDRISKKLKGHLSFMNGYKHSQKIRNKISKGKKGKRTSPTTEFKKGHPFYKGAEKGWFKREKYKRSSGYVRVLKPRHPYATIDNRVFEHRLVYEKWLRKHKPNHPALIEINGIKYLRRKWIVHHINGICSDNRIKNLKLFANQSKHAKSHKS